jgi:hypothetical protein
MGLTASLSTARVAMKAVHAARPKKIVFAGMPVSVLVWASETAARVGQAGARAGIEALRCVSSTARQHTNTTQARPTCAELADRAEAGDHLSNQRGHPAQQADTACSTAPRHTGGGGGE